MMPLACCLINPTYDEGLIIDKHLTIERTLDPEIVAYVWNHPEIKPHIWDQPEEIPILMHPKIYHMAALIDGQLAGIATFMPINPVTWNPHLNILPHARGNGTDILKHAMDWMFANTSCLKMQALPACRRKAMIRVFEKCGFKLEGRSPKSFSFNGVIDDRLLMGIGKE